jgi:L-serine dehydratase
MGGTSIFDIAGPIMVGPSSSHTAGACKIGQFARALFHRTPRRVTFNLHGSFGEVYKGHATDRALLAGVMKLKTSDPRLKDSFSIAEKKGIEYKFVPKDLGKKYHPNTVEIIMEADKHKMSVIGSSIGGGMIEILKIDNFNVHLKGRAGKYLSLIISRKKDPKVMKDIFAKIKGFGGIEIDSIAEESIKNKTLSVLNTRGRRIKLPEVFEIEKSIDGVEFVRSLSKLEKQ